MAIERKEFRVIQKPTCPEVVAAVAALLADNPAWEISAVRPEPVFDGDVSYLCSAVLETYADDGPPVDIPELVTELMGCEHMGDVTRVTRRLAKLIGVTLAGSHGDWSDADWSAIDGHEAEGEVAP